MYTPEMLIDFLAENLAADDYYSALDLICSKYSELLIHINSTGDLDITKFIYADLMEKGNLVSVSYDDYVKNRFKNIRHIIVNIKDCDINTEYIFGLKFYRIYKEGISIYSESDLTIYETIKLSYIPSKVDVKKLTCDR